jgi:hypothetical protein
MLTLLLGLSAPTLAAAPPPPLKHPDPGALAHVLTNGSADALAGSLRGYLVQAVPDPLYEVSPGWGHKSARHDKKQGDWRRIRVTAINLADSLVVDLRDVRPIEPGRMTFRVFVAFDARVNYQHQKWEAGIRLYDGSARARMRAKLTLDCELSSRVESSNLIVSDLVFRIRVQRSDLRLENLVVEHVAGVGGDAAKLLGDAVKHSLREWHPSLERDLLAKANAAIVKAGDTKEVRLSLFNLMKNQGLLSAPSKAPSQQ